MTLEAIAYILFWVLSPVIVGIAMIPILALADVVVWMMEWRGNANGKSISAKDQGRAEGTSDT